MACTSGAYKAPGWCCSAGRRIADISNHTDGMPVALLLQYATKTRCCGKLRSAIGAAGAAGAASKGRVLRMGR